MKRLKSADIQQGKIFRNKFLEKFSKTNIYLTVGFYSLVYILLLAVNFKYASLNWVQTIFIYLSAIIFWTFCEYLIHRFVFHFINNSGWSKRFHYIIHGVHHQFPRDEERLFMPPLPGLLFILIFTCLFYFVLNNTAFIFMAGFINGWAMYVTLHYIVHVYQPVKPFKILWTHHAKHHYQQDNKAYGVSSPLWDFVFGTMPE